MLGASPPLETDIRCLEAKSPNAALDEDMGGLTAIREDEGTARLLLDREQHLPFVIAARSVLGMDTALDGLEDQLRDGGGWGYGRWNVETYSLDFGGSEEFVLDLVLDFLPGFLRAGVPVIVRFRGIEDIGSVVTATAANVYFSAPVFLDLRRAPEVALLGLLRGVVFAGVVAASLDSGFGVRFWTSDKAAGINE